MAKISVILVVGPPGSGKGTLSKRLAKEINVVHLSIGDLCREMVARKTEIGLAIEKAVVAGEFVSNRLILQMLDNRLKKDDIAMANGVIIDGFPRTVEQAEEISKVESIKLERVVLLQAPSDVCLDRILYRRMDPVTEKIYNLKTMPPPKEEPWVTARLIQRPNDHDPKLIRKRQEVYNRSLGAILQFFHQKIEIVDSNRTIDEVFADFKKAADFRTISPEKKVEEEQSAPSPVQQDLCVVCMDRVADYLVLPCGHQCGCKSCLAAQEKSHGTCPICTVKISGLIRVFRVGIADDGGPSSSSSASSSAGIQKKEEETKEEEVEEFHADQMEEKIGVSIAPCQDMEGNAGSIDVVVRLEPPDAMVRVPVDVCCVVDISGSMGELARFQDPNDETKTVTHGLTQLDIVKHSVKSVMHTLTDSDRLSIVSFESYANLVLPLTNMDAPGRSLATQSLEMLMPEDTTDLWGGLFAGLEALRNPPGGESRDFLRGSGDEMIRRSCILLLTDGRPTTKPGRGEAGELKHYFTSNPGFSCQVNTFGFGYGLDSGLLHEIAKEGGGSFAFIPDAKVVGTCFVNAASNICTNMSLRCQATLSVKNGAAWGRPGPNDARVVELGPLYYGQPRDFVVSLQIPPVAGGASPVYLEAIVDWDGGRQRARGTNRNISRDATAGLVRDLAVTRLYEILDMYEKDNTAGANGRLNSLCDTVMAYVSESSFSGSEDDRLRGLLNDLTGRIRKAITTKDRFERWGRHYLYALIRSHNLQLRTNMLDVGLQNYGGALFELLQLQGGEIFMGLPVKRTSDYRIQYNLGGVDPDFVAYDPSAAQQALEPEEPVDAEDYYGGGCFDESSTVFVVDKKEGENFVVRQVRLNSLSKGDRVQVIRSEDGSFDTAEVQCLVQISRPRGESEEALSMIQFGEGKLVITPSHPIRVNGRWKKPKEFLNIRRESEKSEEEEESDEMMGKKVVATSRFVYNVVLDQVHVLIVNGVECCTWGHGIEEEGVFHPFYGGDAIVDVVREMEGWEQGNICLDWKFLKEKKVELCGE